MIEFSSFARSEMLMQVKSCDASALRFSLASQTSSQSYPSKENFASPVALHLMYPNDLVQLDRILFSAMARMKASCMLEEATASF